MRNLILGAVVCLFAGVAAAQAQTADPQLMAPLNKFIDSFNKGDIAGAATVHAADVVIIDEVAPFLWRGPKAFQSWATDLDNDAKKNGLTEAKVTLSPATRVETAGDAAYVIVPSVYTFKVKGVAMRETAQMTFSLKKGAGGWLITGWTWTGPKAQAVSGAAKH